MSTYKTTARANCRSFTSSSHHRKPTSSWLGLSSIRKTFGLRRQTNLRKAKHLHITQEYRNVWINAVRTFTKSLCRTMRAKCDWVCFNWGSVAIAFAFIYRSSLRLHDYLMC
ncbi:hypothetical protein DPMN_087465 [Dreissena polymorpha]|uniref:Uncharacterized protein n=1 Tax=Dreissena polymorpha TaxID=45954 RepID=A0A9D4QWX4_DREPO|nr:hypothetical protein DPMN_087465 [Dreissena polymorpha]